MHIKALNPRVKYRNKTKELRKINNNNKNRLKHENNEAHTLYLYPIFGILKFIIFNIIVHEKKRKNEKKKRKRKREAKHVS